MRACTKVELLSTAGKPHLSPATLPRGRGADLPTGRQSITQRQSIHRALLRTQHCGTHTRAHIHTHTHTRTGCAAQRRTHVTHTHSVTHTVSHTQCHTHTTHLVHALQHLPRLPVLLRHHLHHSSQRVVVLVMVMVVVMVRSATTATATGTGTGTGSRPTRSRCASGTMHTSSGGTAVVTTTTVVAAAPVPVLSGTTVHRRYRPWRRISRGACVTCARACAWACAIVVVVVVAHPDAGPASATGSGAVERGRRQGWWAVWHPMPVCGCMTGGGCGRGGAGARWRW